ncbi:MAG: hypothetical protein NC299_12145, partial [Lachnospiraceae bacterium]|nr:hypothetical protein [Ruminococcus sp.]MCM1276092.1 hypothetical protein [Lachnospiraceae bacterium]
MSIFTNEILRKLREENYNFAVENSMIIVILNGGRIVKIGSEGGLYFDRFFTDNERAEYFALARLINEISEYVSDFENAEKSNEFRVILEYNSVILAAKYDDNSGFEFSTFLTSENGKIISENRYSDYAIAKANFAVRAGLIDGDKFFDFDELETVEFAVELALKNYAYPDGKIREELEKLREKIC